MKFGLKYDILFDMADIASLYDEHKNLSVEQQKKAGQVSAGDMGDEHTDFIKTVSRLVTSGEINVFDTKTFFHPGAYEKLTEEAQGHVDLAIVNIADLLGHIAEFYHSKQTPDASPQLEQMIEELWQMKDRLEGKYGDILKL